MKRETMFVCLCAIFLLSLAGNSLILLHFSPQIGEVVTADLRSEIIKIHAVPLGILLGSILAQRQNKRKVSMAVFGVGTAVSLMWAIFVATAWVGFPEKVLATTAYSVPGVLQHYTQISDSVSFLIAAVLAFVSGQEVKN